MFILTLKDFSFQAESPENPRTFVPITNDDNHVKHILVSVDRDVYLVKDPYTGRAFLPCFELSRLLGTDEQDLLNFVG